MQTEQQAASDLIARAQADPGVMAKVLTHAAKEGYPPRAASHAAKRASRWIRNKNDGNPPGHIKDKINLVNGMAKAAGVEYDG